jgi:Protein of unknown function, DUF547
MKKILAILIAFFLVGCASVRAPVTTTTPTEKPPYAAWERVLEKFVNADGQINFAGLAKDRADLDQFVAYVYAQGPNNAPQHFPTPNHVLAYHINAYNALSMYKVIDVGIPETNAGLRKVFFFTLGNVQVGGESISLYNYENKVIRPLGDPRIHMALNCMSVSCPRLPRDVFLAETLDIQLDRETRKFFSEARNATADDVKKTFTLSEILKFFTEDFLIKDKTLTAFVNRYRVQQVLADYKVTFFDYDWTINRQRQ